MLVRILSSIVALPVLFFFVIKGGLFLEIGVGVIALLALYEFLNALKSKYKPFTYPTYTFLILFYILYRASMFTALSGVFVLYLTSIFIMYVLDNERKVADLSVTLLPAIYVTFFLYHIILFTKLDQSFYIWLIFIVSWGADTGAYFIGKKFGKRKLAPIVSPNKSVEGAIGGMVSASIMAVALSLYFDSSFVFFSILIAIPGSMISIFGDLFASKIKREMGIKDYGNVMPGHGGAMDRFDSLLLVTPFVYYAIQLILWIK